MTHLWSDSIVQRSYINVNLIWSTPVETTILAELRCNPDDISVTKELTLWLLQVENNCICHRLKTAQEKAWTNTTAVQHDIDQLYNNCKKLVTFVKMSTNIQLQLDTTVKQGGATRHRRNLRGYPCTPLFRVGIQYPTFRYTVFSHYWFY